MGTRTAIDVQSCAATAPGELDVNVKNDAVLPGWKLTEARGPNDPDR